MFFDEINAGTGDHIIAVLVQLKIVPLFQEQHREQQVLTREGHDRFELQQRDAGVVGIAAAPRIQQAQNSQTAIRFAINTEREIPSLKQVDGLGEVLLINVVVGNPQIGVRKRIESFIEQQKTR